MRRACGALVLVLAQAACAEERGGARDATVPDVPTLDGSRDGGPPTDATRDAPSEPTTSGPIPDDEAFPTPVPDTVRPGAVSRGRCLVRGVTLNLGEAQVFDDCVVCQCGILGLRCARRVSCARPVCVLAEGTVLGVGEAATIDGCFTCECAPTGPRCRRAVGGECPAEGCRIYWPEADERRDVGFGQLLISETSLCTCDRERGFVDCTDVVTCERPGDGGVARVDTRAPHPSGCGSCLCFGGRYDFCERRNCTSR